MATSKRTRVFMGFLAGLFLFTSSAFTIAVIWQNSQSSSSSSDSQTNQSSDTTKTTPTPPKTSKLSGFTPTSQPLTKLQVIDIKKGTGAAVQAGATVTVDYTGALMKNGVIFDASSLHGGAQPVSLQQVIAGWSQGIPGMKVGGTRRLLIPAALGYGSSAQTGIPANSDLVFDVTVHKIDK